MSIAGTTSSYDKAEAYTQTLGTALSPRPVLCYNWLYMAIADVNYMVRVMIPVAPVPKPRMTRSDAWKQRPAVLRYWAFKDELAACITGTLDSVFMVTFYVEMPKSWSKKKKAEMLGKAHQDKPDVDNYLKAFMDALCENDSYVYDVRARKFWAEAGYIELVENPAYL